MAKKKLKTTNTPKWLKSKWFLFGFALVVAGGAVVGYKTFAYTLPTYSTPLNTCMTQTLGYANNTNNKDCVKYAQGRLNHYFKGTWLNPDLDVDGLYGSKTRERVECFQWIHGINPNGNSASRGSFIDGATWKRLNDLYNWGVENAWYCNPTKPVN